MSSMPHDATNFLNHLVQINKDAQAGFLAAAENIQNSELETLFTKYATHYANFAAELQAEIERLGGTYSDSGTLGGALHRGWFDLRSTLSGHSAAAILTSCETGEDSAEAPTPKPPTPPHRTNTRAQRQAPRTNPPIPHTPLPPDRRNQRRRGISGKRVTSKHFYWGV